jgi:hypothetical protein
MSEERFSRPYAFECSFPDKLSTSSPRPSPPIIIGREGERSLGFAVALLPDSALTAGLFLCYRSRDFRFALGITWALVIILWHGGAWQGMPMERAVPFSSRDFRLLSKFTNKILSKVQYYQSMYEIIAPWKVAICY